MNPRARRIRRQRRKDRVRDAIAAKEELEAFVRRVLSALKRDARSMRRARPPSPIPTTRSACNPKSKPARASSPRWPARYRRS